MSVQAELLAEIESFLATRGGMAETTFGRLAVNDGKFVRRLREGCNMTLATIERTKKFMKSQRPTPDIIAPTSKPKAKRPAPATRSESPPSESDKAA